MTKTADEIKVVQLYSKNPTYFHFLVQMYIREMTKNKTQTTKKLKEVSNNFKYYNYKHFSSFFLFSGLNNI